MGSSFAITALASGLGQLAKTELAANSPVVSSLTQGGIQVGSQLLQNGKITNYSGILLASIPEATTAAKAGSKATWGMKVGHFLQDNKFYVGQGLNVLESHLRDNDIDWTNVAASTLLQSINVGSSKDSHQKNPFISNSSGKGHLNWQTIAADALVSTAAAMVIGNRYDDSRAVNYLGYQFGSIVTGMLSADQEIERNLVAGAKQSAFTSSKFYARADAAGNAPDNSAAFKQADQLQNATAIDANGKPVARGSAGYQALMDEYNTQMAFNAADQLQNAAAIDANGKPVARGSAGYQALVGEYNTRMAENAAQPPTPDNGQSLTIPENRSVDALSGMNLRLSPDKGNQAGLDELNQRIVIGDRVSLNGVAGPMVYYDVYGNHIDASKIGNRSVALRTPYQMRSAPIDPGQAFVDEMRQQQSEELAAMMQIVGGGAEFGFGATTSELGFGTLAMIDGADNIRVGIEHAKGLNMWFGTTYNPDAQTMVSYGLENGLGMSRGEADIGAGIFSGLLTMGACETQVLKGGIGDVGVADRSLMTGAEFKAARLEGRVPDKLPTNYFDNLATQATRNSSSSKVVLGKFLEDGKSYTKVGAHYEASYFKLDNWRDITKTMSQDDIWKVNESFLRQQIKQDKQIILSHDPAKATGFYAREVDYLEALGYKFTQDNWVWKATR